MAEDLGIVTGTRQEQYASLLPQIAGLLDGETDLIANLANICGALKEQFGWLWVGFYIVKNGQLVLGPFQGPVACTRIDKGRGVCGTSWAEGRTLIVGDVEQFPGHIACSSRSRSEIVVPLLCEGEVWGVLDVDSESLAEFDETDRHYLEKNPGANQITVAARAPLRMKDYYQILELAPGAGLEEIRKAYRRLVMKYHPDKNGDDPYSNELFRDVQEAYEILTDPTRKRSYLEQRWYNDFLAKKADRYEVLSPSLILRKALELDRFVSSIDIFRFDNRQLATYIAELLDDNTVAKLRDFNEPEVNLRIATILLHTSRAIHYQHLTHTLQLIERLDGRGELREQFNAERKRRQALHRWENVKVLFAIAVALLLCLLIWWMSEV